MKKLLILAVPMLALAACGDNAATNAASDTGNAADQALGKAEDATAGMVGMGSAPMANNTAASYVTEAAIGDMYEIESSKLALQKSQSADVKKFAQQMIDDHTATTANLKSTIAEAGLALTPPASLDSRRQGMIDNLKALSGADFDAAYLDQQTAAHSEALTLHSGFAQDGDNDALKKLAAETAPKIQGHLDMVKKLDSSGADEAQ